MAQLEATCGTSRRWVLVAASMGAWRLGSSLATFGMRPDTSTCWAEELIETAASALKSRTLQPISISRGFRVFAGFPLSL